MVRSLRKWRELLSVQGYDAVGQKMSKGSMSKLSSKIFVQLLICYYPSNIRKPLDVPCHLATLNYVSMVHDFKPLAT
jgi:hypothetical protein